MTNDELLKSGAESLSLLRRMRTKINRAGSFDDQTTEDISKTVDGIVNLNWHWTENPDSFATSIARLRLELLLPRLKLRYALIPEHENHHEGFEPIHTNLWSFTHNNPYRSNIGESILRHFEASNSLRDYSLSQSMLSGCVVFVPLSSGVIVVETLRRLNPEFSIAVASPRIRMWHSEREEDSGAVLSDDTFWPNVRPITEYDKFIVLDDISSSGKTRMSVYGEIRNRWPNSQILLNR